MSISEEYLEHECQRAQQSPAYENTFRRLHLNIRTEQDVRWLSMEKWDRCGGALDLEAFSAEAREAVADLGQLARLASPDEEPGGGDDDYVELVEYVRVAVMTVYEETAAGGAPATGE